MTQNLAFDTKTSGWTKAFSSLVIPLCVGLSGYFGIMVLIEQGFITNDVLLRYLTGHPISKITLGMFCIGIAGLALIADNVFKQYRRCAGLRLGNRSGENGSKADQADLESTLVEDTVDELVDPAKRAQSYIEELNEYPVSVQDHYLWQRLYSAMQFVCRTGTANGVEEELKYLADVDHHRQQQRYSLVRILIWATPMLGFLGTVLGISQALGGIQVGPENDFQQMMGGLRSSLYIAFDTTALALTLSIVLMFVQFLVDRFEIQLLQQVEVRAGREIAVNFASDAQIDPRATALERIGRTVLASTHQVVLKQTELWQSTIRSAEQAWLDAVTNANLTVGENLDASVSAAVGKLGATMGDSIDQADKSMSKRWEQWQVSLSDNARMMASNQHELIRQTEMLGALLKQMNESDRQGTDVEGAKKDVSTAPVDTPTQFTGMPQVYFNAVATDDHSHVSAYTDEQAKSVEPQVVSPASLKIFRGGSGPRPTARMGGSDEKGQIVSDNLNQKRSA